MLIDRNFWKNKKVLITGHTGFKGSWLCLWLVSMGAQVTGYALDPPTEPNLFTLCRIGEEINSIHGDIRDKERLSKAINENKPEIIFHMAAQPIVKESYKRPVETFEVNATGTANLLESVRYCEHTRAVVNVSTDKCYENKEWYWSYRENDPLGGYDPYSCSKACMELITASYRNSFFNPNDYCIHKKAIATARAGNVIGGGDWASDRLIPDCVRAVLGNNRILLRNPDSIRPWQHVLEPLSGYILLAGNLYNHGPRYAESWNFGPEDNDVKTVEWIADTFCRIWGDGASYECERKGHEPHEAKYLKLDCSKAKYELGWRPVWDLKHALEKVIEWVKVYRSNSGIIDATLKQIDEYCIEIDRGAKQ